MRFALLGDHPDGMAVARALVESGRHEVVAFVARPEAAQRLREWCPSAKPVGDLEEALADPAVEAVIVAGRLADRPALLRRSLQSERHVLCVYPPDQTADMAYEAALIQGDTRRVLFPLLPFCGHPAVAQLAALFRREGPQPGFRLLQLERRSPHVAYHEPGIVAAKPSLPDWFLLRAIGGEIAEVLAFSRSDEFTPEEPLLVSGRFERGGLFQATLLPGFKDETCRLTVVASGTQAELVLERGLTGPARLAWIDETGAAREEAWPAWDPWPNRIAAFEAEVALNAQDPSARQPRWQDAIHAQELDDAFRRSLERRRASTLEYPEASEEVGFKGTMTLVGCGLLWGILFLLILANWVPAAKWVIIPILVVFLGLQLLRWIIPRSGHSPRSAKDAS